MGAFFRAAHRGIAARAGGILMKYRTLRASLIAAYAVLSTPPQGIAIERSHEMMICLSALRLHASLFQHGH